MKRNSGEPSPDMPHSSKYEHQTVLCSQALELWRAKPGGCFVDATLGLGGHTEALLEIDPDATVIGLDIDSEALGIAGPRLAKFGSRVRLIKEGYMNLAHALSEMEIHEVDGILADLGVSSLQIDRPHRGFSFQKQGPLDMRMDSGTARTALSLIEDVSAEELSSILKEFGEERLAWPIAKRLKAAAEKGELKDTLDCAKIASSVYGAHKHSKIHPATRTFQALRIAVNGELNNLRIFLNEGPQLLAKGGRMVCISFHSLEDRMVKESFRELSRGCTCPADFPQCACGKTAQYKVLTKKPVIAAEEETAQNPRSRSAKMRALEKI